ncbi:MAG: DNA translocase FtsK [Acidobacteria bacterium]|nr:DNA translocase FtsK [Acidobacteriota bacterium]
MATRARRRTTNPGNRSRYNEITAIILVAVALLMLLCLVSYHPSDWSFNTSTSQGTKNWAGVVGSVFADILFQSVGLMAYALPFLVLLVALKCFQSKSLFVPPARLLGFLLFIFSGTGLFTLFSIYGGIIGAFAERISSYLLSSIGAGIFLTALFLASILLITNLSFVSFFDSFQMAWANFRMRFGAWFSKYRKWRAENQEEALARAEKRNQVRDEIKKIETPTISTGAPSATEVIEDVHTTENPLKEKLNAVVSRLSQPPGYAGDHSDETPKQDDSEKAVKELKDLSNKTDPVSNGRSDAQEDLVEEGTKIPVKPIGVTGELEVPNDAGENNKIDIAEKPARNFDSYELPKIEYLTIPPPRIEHNELDLQATARNLVESAQEFNVKGQVKNINLGPVVTTYEFKPDPGVKYARVTGLADDLCLALKAESIRIERIPGKAVVGMEVPNKEREVILLRDVIDSKEFRESESPLTIALGKVIDGHRRVADLAKMPHLLIAGATGAGKSVGVNSLIVSILYKAKPDEVKFIMVDPKRLELGLYADIPHLATPIITDPKRAAISLRWAVGEMERRYKELAGWGVRNIDGFNRETKRKNKLKQYDEDGNPHKSLPYIVIIIDELADLMMVSGKEVEESITRLAQMARAVGIHLVLATQRPSVDVITGLIKANFPSRISFRVSSKIDSRTIIDANGAERLLGKGDMLFLPPGTSHLIRVHGTYVDEKEIHKIVSHIKSQANPDYDETITRSEEEMDDFGDLPGRKDELFGEALRTVVNSKRASTSLLQRHLRIGYGRAAAILDALVADGFIGEMDGSKRARPVTQKAFEALQEMEDGREF